MKTNVCALSACLLLLSAAPHARAQALPSPEAWMASGHHKKRVGAALMITGGALVLAGTGLLVAGSWHGSPCWGGYDHGYHSYDYGYGYGCGEDALTLAGATTTALGVGTIIPGIFVYADGGGDIDEGRRLARCRNFCWQGLQLRLSP